MEDIKELETPLNEENNSENNENQSPKCEHTPAEAVRENEIPATCTTEGSYEEVVYCSECEAEISRETKTIDKLSHTPAEAVRENEIPATCTTEGSYEDVVYCAVCETVISSFSTPTPRLSSIRSASDTRASRALLQISILRSTYGSLKTKTTCLPIGSFTTSP